MKKKAAEQKERIKNKLVNCHGTNNELEHRTQDTLKENKTKPNQNNVPMRNLKSN